MAGIIFTLLILAATPELNAQPEAVALPTNEVISEVSLIDFDENSEPMKCPLPRRLVIQSGFRFPSESDDENEVVEFISIGGSSQ